MEITNTNPNVQEAASIIRANKEYLSATTMDKFFQKVAETIEHYAENGFDEYYEEDLVEISGAVSKLLDNAGIKWLNYVTILPPGAFGYFYEDMTFLRIPSNVSVLDPDVLWGSSIEEILVEGKIKRVWGGSLRGNYLRVVTFKQPLKPAIINKDLFGDTDTLTDIYVQDTMEDMKNIGLIIDYSPEVVVHCKDGNLIYRKGKIEEE